MLSFDDEMVSWTTPQYSRAQVDRAGAMLIDLSVSFREREEAWEIANNWRSSHSYPLNHFQVALRQKANQIDPSNLVAQRLKRRSSIELKLKDNSAMKLSQMQDLGGCRAIVATIAHVDKLVELYDVSRMNHERLRTYDYIREPKDSGYRGIHLVYRYISHSERGGPYDGLRIEVQLRSPLQHAWATAVEIAGTFTGQALKSSHGSQDWLRFFQLMGTEIALQEKSAPVPDTPTDNAQLVKELRSCVRDLDVIHLLQAWTRSIKAHEDQVLPNAHYFRVELDANTQRLTITSYAKNQIEQAQQEYTQREQALRGQPGADVVLVSGVSLKELPRAYPNYYLDTTAFVRELERAIS